ncbi:MAG: NAD-dependent epimerase/dehydratase family protein [Candidatus Bathyarchaeota archaeon]|nr:NAD-dependent epimerase/dehydratase family protein [Candidatus Bathyarchaeota archaeon]
MDEKVLEAFNGKTILVTGGAGAIGSNLVATLEKLETEKIVILDDLSSSYEWNMPVSPKVLFIKGNILDDEKLKWAFRNRPQIVYHLAAHFANQNSVDNPETDLMVNGMGTLKVLEYAHLVGVERFIYASSGCGIYGAGSKMPFEEHDVSMKLYTPYQVTKMLGELYTNYYYNLYHLPIVNARFFNSYGPGEVPGKYRNVIPNFFYWSINKQPLPITGTGDETRDFTYVGDIINGLLAMAYYKEAIGEAFNLATGREIRIGDLAKWINEITGNPAGIVYADRRDWDKKNRLLASINKAKKILGYNPNMDFKEGLKQVNAWFKANWKNISASYKN